MLFDADCGFCTRSAGWVRRLPFDVEQAAIQSSDLDALGVDADRALLEMPFVAADGTVRYGHRAWAAVLRTGPLLARVVGGLLDSRLLSRPAAWVYRWVSRNRDRLPGGTPTCSPAGRACRDPAG